MTTKTADPDTVTASNSTASSAPSAPITLETLNQPACVLTLGALCAKALASVGQISLFVNAQGEIEAAPPGEIQLDSLPEDQAIQRLQASGYGDPQLMAYLKGRDARIPK